MIQDVYNGTKSLFASKKTVIFNLLYFKNKDLQY